MRSAPARRAARNRQTANRPAARHQHRPAHQIPRLPDRMQTDRQRLCHRRLPGAQPIGPSRIGWPQPPTADKKRPGCAGTAWHCRKTACSGNGSAGRADNSRTPGTAATATQPPAAQPPDPPHPGQAPRSCLQPHGPAPSAHAAGSAQSRHGCSNADPTRRSRLWPSRSALHRPAAQPHLVPQPANRGPRWITMASLVWVMGKPLL